MYIVCVTACPLGIAHTFMAAENLKNAIERAGHEAKVETQGADGQVNTITAEDLERADGVILASDAKVRDLERFDDLPTLEASVYEACNDADGLVAELVEAIG